MKFRSAIDSWFYLLTLVLPGVVFILVIMTLGAANIGAILVLGIVAVFAIGLPLWLLRTTYYLVQDETLIIRSGPFRWSIPLRDIKAVKASRSLLSSPALSMRRLEIQYGSGRTILVSPQDTEGFKRAIGWA